MKINKNILNTSIKTIFMQLPLIALILYNALLVDEKHNDKTRIRTTLSNIQSILFQPKQKLIQQKSVALADEVTAVFTSSNRYDLLERSLDSFFTMNTYPLKSFIVVDDDIINPQFIKMTNKYPNITWISANRKVGQVFATDMAYTLIQTPYYFHSEDDWIFLQPGFMEESLQILKKYPRSGQSIIGYISWAPSSQRQGYYLAEQSMYTGKNPNPALHRFAQYQSFQNQIGTYSDFFKYQTFGLGMGGRQYFLAQHFAQKGYRAFKTKKNYIKHIGGNRGLPKALL